jgi:hypothetical protein
MRREDITQGQKLVDSYQINDFGTAIAVLLLLDAFSAIVRVANSRVAANDATALQTSVIAFVANVCDGMWIHKGAAYATQTVACGKNRSFMSECGQASAR